MNKQSPENASSIYTMWLEEDGLLMIEFKPTPEHTVEDARALVAQHNVLAEGKKVRVLADCRKITVSASKEAREHYVSEEGARCKLGMAMVVDNMVQRMIGNIFFRMNKPPYPTRLFSDLDTARTWLNSIPREVRP